MIVKRGSVPAERKGSERRQDMGLTWNPTVEVESARGIREVSLNTKHLMERCIFLTGEIDSDVANGFLSQLLYLEKQSPNPVTVYVNSPGGNVNSGLLIYDAVQGCNLEVRMVCTGAAASMAALILAGGTKGKRFILRHSNVMIHEPLITSGLGGSATSIKNISDSILETREILNGILAKHTGKTIDEINKATAFDNIMNAEEAVKFGICDAVTDRIRIE